jgi:hypothetical protein
LLQAIHDGDETVRRTSTRSVSSRFLKPPYVTSRRKSARPPPNR